MLAFYNTTIAGLRHITERLCAIRIVEFFIVVFILLNYLVNVLAGKAIDKI